MRHWTMVGRAAVAVWLASTATAQDEAKSAPPRVLVLGASVSSGFSCDIVYGTRDDRNSTFKLTAVLRKAWHRDRVLITDYSKVDLFRRPTQIGPKLVERGLKKKPDLVVAVDFVFWFGYGSVFGREQTEARLARQKVALDLLEQFECPIMLGDYPDMTGADPRICPKSLIPNKADIAKLNETLRAWAAKRENVKLFPLAKWVEEVKAGKYELEIGDARRKLSTAQLLQKDELHATRLGATLIGSRVLGFVPELMGAKHELAKDLPTVSALAEEMGVEEELAEGAKK